MPLDRLIENVDAHFKIKEKDGSVVGSLSYELTYFGEDILKHKADLSIPGVWGKNFSKKGITHYFINGDYVYSELEGSDLLDMIQLPEGMVLPRIHFLRNDSVNEDYAEGIRRFREGDHKGAEKILRRRIKIDLELHHHTRVVITDFEIPLEIRTLLQETKEDEPLIETLLGNYL